MGGHRWAELALSLGVAFTGGVVLGAWGPATESFRGLPAVVVGVSMLAGAALVAVVGYRRSTAAFESLRLREQELKRLQAEFIQNVTHELRQPLTLVRGYVELLTNGRLDEEVRRRLCSAALARTVDLVERVESITTLQQMPREQMKLEPIDLVDLASTALKMVWQRAYRAGVVLRLDGPPDVIRVLGDPLWLLEALKQLLDNAIKFSSRDGTVTVRIGTTEDEARVEVADEGVGIPAGQLERVFAPFCQADGSPSRRFGGVGLGLTIVQTVAEAHGGRLWATSAGQGKGSVFGLALPLALTFPARPPDAAPYVVGATYEGLL